MCPGPKFRGTKCRTLVNKFNSVLLARLSFRGLPFCQKQPHGEKHTFNIHFIAPSKRLLLSFQKLSLQNDPNLHIPHNLKVCWYNVTVHLFNRKTKSINDMYVVKTLNRLEVFSMSYISEHCPQKVQRTLNKFSDNSPLIPFPSLITQ